MAKNNNLIDFLTDIATVIRAKKGTSDLINPQDFSDEIAKLGINSGNSPFSWDWSQIGYTPENVLLQQQFEDDIAYSKSLAETFSPSNPGNPPQHFRFNRKLKFVPLVDTSNVTNMTQMFDNDFALITIPPLDTSKVTNMLSMFTSCSSLSAIPPLDTSKVTSMCYMFHNCFSLTTIPQLDTSNVTIMSYMFTNCSALTTIPQLNTSKVTDMGRIFENCENLRKITQLDLSNVTYTYNMFTNCPHLNYILLTNIGRNENSTEFHFDGATAWGYGEDYEVNKQSLIDSIVNNTFDRASAGYSTATIYLSYYVESLFTEEQLEQVRNKGYNISFVAPPSTE